MNRDGGLLFGPPCIQHLYTSTLLINSKVVILLINHWQQMPVRSFG